MGGGTISGHESFTLADSRADKRRQKTVDRLAGRIVKAVDRGRTSYEVTDGWTGIFPSTNEPEVYAAVAEQLGDREEPIEIAAHRFTGQQYRTPSLDVSLFDGPEVVYTHDVITIQSIGGTAIEHEPYRSHGNEKHTQLYPPEE